MIFINRFLDKHPEYMEQGVTLSQFSFQTPKPLQENYVRKRPARVPDRMPPPMAALPGPHQQRDLELDLRVHPMVKKARSAPGKQIRNFDLMFRQHDV